MNPKPASYGVHHRIRDRKRWREFLSFFKTLRRRWPDQRLYLILDNFSPHKHPEVRAWCAANDVDLVFLPTYASRLNWIEAEFAAVRYFALNGTDHRTHAEQDTAIGDYIRWRNQRARPKSGFAINSKIRHPDYPFGPAGGGAGRAPRQERVVRMGGCRTGRHGPFDDDVPVRRRHAGCREHAGARLPRRPAMRYSCGPAMAGSGTRPVRPAVSRRPAGTRPACRGCMNGRSR
ncbi:hypothetical protein B0E53_00884 [Micromonospora sp. MH33]|uniref:transposase n=1 Tax=Micromonospora sp. MH33 TaxID=1945509 RepID=UPI000D2E33BF|nr:transposase [Micromonospora sp. MH33]PSK67156.1 hypothetical protein B0E53_00884 [Micromonospora sp. MH33]